MARRDRDRPKHKNAHHHDKDHKPKGGGPGGTPGTVTEDIKMQSTQTSQDALNATPASRPDPANADAVYTTGPGQAVEYNYQRLGTYSEDYAQQQSQATAPVPAIAGNGQVLTSAASGASNNPT